MKKNAKKELLKEKIFKISNSKEQYSQKYCKNNSTGNVKSKKSLMKRSSRNEDSKYKNKDNKKETINDLSKKKDIKKIINKPSIPMLYSKKKAQSNNNINSSTKKAQLNNNINYSKKKAPSININNCLVNTIKKTHLSCTQERIYKYINKLPNKPRNIEKKNSVFNDLSKCPDIDLEIEKELENEEEDHIHIPHMSSKKKINYFFDLQKSEMKGRNETNISRDFSIKMNDTIDKNKNRFVIFPKSIYDRRFQFENICKMHNKHSERAKTQKKIDKNKEDKSFRHYYINKMNSFIIKNNFKEKLFNRNKKESLFEYNNLLISKTNLNYKICGINNNNNNDLKSKTIEYDLTNSNGEYKKTHGNKNINISFIDNPNLKNINENNNNAINENINDLISEKETIDSPENISDREEEEKLSLPIHKNNYFFIIERKRYAQKLERNHKKQLSPKQNLYFNISDLGSTDENCYAHKTNISVNYTNIKSSSKDNNISNYKENINRFKNLTSEKKLPLSLLLSPSQRNNLFKQTNSIIKKVNENIYNTKINNNNFELNTIQINLSYFLLKKTGKIAKIKILIKNFLDIKSLIKLSSLNKKYYINFRHFLFEFLFSECFESAEKRKFERKAINSIFQYSSKNLKNKADLKNIYSNCRIKSKYESNILKDLTRTFPKDKSFSKESKNYKKLYNILVSYSNYNKNIGYTQGMNFLGAISIYLFESEEKSFLFLDSLINRFELYNFFGIDTKNKLISKLVNYSNILHKYIPEIISYLDKQQISHDFFSTGWILTLFSNSMKREFLITSWAFMIIFGWKFFYSFVIQVLINYKEDIFNTNVNKLCIKMKGILSDNKFDKEYNNIIKKTLHFMNNNIIL